MTRPLPEIKTAEPLPPRPAIRIHDLHKTFGELVAIGGVSFDIKQGEFFMIVGPSGCGKTTLLRILAGLDTITSGTIEIATPNSQRPVNSMIFQGDSIFPWMTVWSNAAYGLKMRGASATTIKEVVGHYLARTGLTRFADYYPHQLSGGMRQRVAIARAFVNDPEILLMDELFSALDAQNKLLLQEELLRIWEEHKKTVVFITHSLDEAVFLGDRIMVMTAQPGGVKTFVPVPLARPREHGAAEGAGIRRAARPYLAEPARGGAPRATPGRGDNVMSVQITTSGPRAAAKMSARSRDRLLNVVSPLALLLVWELCARFHFIDTRFFPAPSSVIATLIDMLRTGELVTHTAISMQRLAYGTILGALPALILGIAMGLNRPIRALFDPLIAATYPVPKSAILPLALLIFGLGEGSKIFMVAIGVFFPMVINTTTGVLEINKIYLDVGRNYKASRWNTFWTIALPGALPVIMTGFKLGIGIGLVLIAVAEMVGAKSGLGYLIWSAWSTFAVEEMYVGLFAIAIIGFLITLGLNELERVIIPWKAE
jgi:ABC-type nitrate/sulfonate/bicarbonate transport system ATPase subunit/ABC-type nitrate/sulfonate/bicarbonate transport system permease component